MSSSGDYHTYGVEYEYEGKTYSFHLEAESYDDLEKRLHAIAATGFPVGQLVHVEDANDDLVALFTMFDGPMRPQ